MNNTKEILLVCAALQKYQVQYLLIGGAAVGFHGYSRMSSQIDGTISEKQDVDFWFNPTYNNYFNLLKALKELSLEFKRYEKDVLLLIEEKSPKPKESFLKFEFETLTLDFLPKVIGLDLFIPCFEKRKISCIDGIEISILTLEYLLITKSKLGRKKDLDDIEKLKDK